MNKELKALQAFDNLCGHLDYDVTDYMFNGNYEEDANIIEKSLKALEIIKKKRVNVSWFIHCQMFNSPLMMYNELHDKRELTQEEYELLKEVLKGDN